ncbi:MAG TPA: DUF5658 family protein [Armatimonadota bacterium]|nr:DUF5658 family protein [Armatimonadota bacterium]
MRLTISRESLCLIAICLADTLLTIVLVASGLAKEANPLMVYCVDRGYGIFCLVKLGTLIPTVVAAEMYRASNPVFVRRALRTGIAAYLCLYFGGLLAVNFV